jgi:hypothetical protein
MATEGEQAQPDAGAEDAVLSTILGDEPAIEPEVVAVAKRDNIPEPELARMSAEGRQAYAERARARQAENDSFSSRMKALEEENAALKAAQQPKPEPTGDPAGQQAATPPKDDPALTKRMESLEARTIEAETRAADAALRAQHGAKAPEYATVKKRMAELGAANPGKYADVAELAAEAYRELVPPARHAPGTQPGNSRQGAVGSNPSDREDVILNHLLNGKTAAEAVALADAR